MTKVIQLLFAILRTRLKSDCFNGNGEGFFSLTNVQIGYRAHPILHLVCNMGYFPWDKVAVWKDDQLPATGVKGKYEWTYISNPPICFQINKGTSSSIWCLCA
jgi:hypothetical protein